LSKQEAKREIAKAKEELLEAKAKLKELSAKLIGTIGSDGINRSRPRPAG
jgi:hypothetical protein